MSTKARATVVLRVSPSDRTWWGGSGAIRTLDVGPLRQAPRSRVTIPCGGTLSNGSLSRNAADSWLATQSSYTSSNVRSASVRHVAIGLCSRHDAGSDDDASPRSDDDAVGEQRLELTAADAQTLRGVSLPHHRREAKTASEVRAVIHPIRIRRSDRGAREQSTARH